MATTRMRRAGANPLPPEFQDTRGYQEEESGWTADAYLPDEAFLPDEEGEIYDEVPLAEDGYSEEYLPLFDEDADFDDDLDPLDDELLTDEERAELKRSHWQLIAGLTDFAGVILGTAAILVLVTLLVSLLNWLINDLSQSFILLQKNF